MRPRGENVEYDKLADRFYASNRALADAEKRIAALEAGLTESRQLLGVYRTQRDAAEERTRALDAELAESTRHRDQNRETAVALQGRVSALEAALRKYGIELVEWTSGVWTYNCRACDHGNGTTFLPTDIEHDPACELMALFKDTAAETTAKSSVCRCGHSDASHESYVGPCHFSDAIGHCICQNFQPNREVKS